MVPSKCAKYVPVNAFHISHSFWPLPCLPFQNGQNGQSSPRGKSWPSSCGQPMLLSVVTTDLTPCF